MRTRGGTVPIVISYRRVTEKPEIRRTTRFVGWSGIVHNLAIKAIEFIQEVCYETEREVLNAGSQQVVHWALEVEDPWSANQESSLVAVRVSDKPACGAHFEIITVEEPKNSESQPTPAKGDAPPTRMNSKFRPDQDRIRAMMRRQLRAEDEGSEDA